MKRHVKKIKAISFIIILMLFTFSFMGFQYVANAAAILAPTSVRAASSSYSSINISWGGVTGSSGYSVYRATSKTGYYTQVLRTTSGNYYNNTGLVTGRTYYYKVAAYRIVGSSRVYSNYSAIVCSRPLPPAPTSVKAVSSSYSSVNISWGGVTGANGYSVYRALSSTGSYSKILTTTARNYNITGLSTGSTYYYKVAAYRIVGRGRVYSNYSAVVSCKAVPSAPTSVKAELSSNNVVNISWGGVAGASGYAVYRSTSNEGTYTQIAATTSRNYNDTGLISGTTYYYKVAAYRIVGSGRVYSNYSAVVSSRPLPPAPTPVKAISSSYNSISVSWGGVTGANGYAIYRATSSTGAYTLISTTEAISYNDTGLVTGRTYYYKVAAYRLAGSDREYSNYSAAASSRPLPPAPTPVKALSSSYNSISISWGTVTGASGYSVYRATSKTGYYTQIIRTTTGSYYSDTGLTTGGTYYYKVAAYRIVGSSRVYSNYSAVVNSRPLPSAPTSVKAVSSSSSSIDISWSGTNEANGYSVYRASSSTGIYTQIVTTASTNYNDTGLTLGQTYYYKVAAYRLIGGGRFYSNYSSVVSGTTLVINVTSISLNKNSDTLTLGDTDTLKASIDPTNATNQSVTWTSSDNTIATVDNSGKVTAVGAGTAVITVTTADGSKTAECIVTVNNGQIKGIDASKFQGTIDWSLVKDDGVQFAMIRSSFGDGTSNYSNNGIDSMFETNYESAKANGIAVGAYHYSYASSVDEAGREADFFISHLKGKQFEYPVCVDLEDPSQRAIDQETLTDIALTYLNKLKQAGYYPLIYANKYWFTSVLDDSRLTTYDHWLAQWSSSITYTGKVGIWQYTSSGTVNGIAGNVDMDTSFFDYESIIKSLHLNGF